MRAAGKLDRRIKICRVTTMPDEDYHPVETEEVFRELWAEYLPARGSEKHTGRADVATRQAVFRVRYYDGVGVTAKMRILFESEAWDITDVRELGRRDALELSAEVRDS